MYALVSLCVLALTLVCLCVPTPRALLFLVELKDVISSLSAVHLKSMFVSINRGFSFSITPINTKNEDHVFYMDKSLSSLHIAYRS